MADERTDRQAQIDPWADVNEIELSKTPGIGFVYQASVVDAARAADAALLRERDAQIASLTAQVETMREGRDAYKWNAGKAMEKENATLRAERDAAQQERDRLKEQMQFFADAKPETWDDPADFRLWVQSRARYLLAPFASQEPGGHQP